ncbi:MAG: hypothetical protein KJ606_13730 [Chloroflexi bacterium]|nr:hypothetical protein [Chloroflexota bacterium]
MSERKWLKQWSVPSESGARPYKVSLDLDGETYVCHCWPFLRERTTCKHIKKVLAGEVPEIGEDLPPEPVIEFWNVREVIPVTGRGGRIVRVKTPFVSFDDTHFTLTVVYDLLKAGVSMTTLRNRYRLPKDLTRVDIEAYIQQYGRKIYGPWEEERGQHVGYEFVR